MRKRIASLAVLAATITAVPAAQADVSTAGLDCDERLERLEDRFYLIADRRGYEEATEWWEQRWARYHAHCVLGA
jgi:hypothetical protein